MTLPAGEYLCCDRVTRERCSADGRLFGDNDKLLNCVEDMSAGSVRTDYGKHNSA
jgi:hypothetical protein